ncbi:Threonine synthase-like 1 [Acropora cervicornis]|uniref:Threonine synthase-like 1 n=1 Tax=Acropora cervicornis TaxID=6130 RepID=A0AAD9PXK8_ACRCE|nr:Threonine synthase-like 1 [Acropora cervicornis]
MFLLRLPKLNFRHPCLSVVRANSRAIFIAAHFSHGKCKQQPRFLTSNFKSTALRSYSSNAARFQDDRKKGNNIILMGSPGAGKTTVGRILGHHLGREVIDVDDDVLEKVWGISVAEKLSEVGSHGFVDAEGQAVMQFSASDSVISLSGSNPMHREAMNYIKSLGDVIYLDVADDDILNRLAAMKVNRIIGQNEGISMSEILQYRKQFYESSYDVRVSCARGDSAEEIANKTLKTLKETQDEIGFISTREERAETDERPGFLDVVLEGLAPDGGLFVPRRQLPFFTEGQWERFVDCSYQERALRILEAWVSPSDLHPSSLRTMIDLAYSTNFQHEAIAPVIKLNDQFFIQELFHGPTASFKDLALQLTPQFFSEGVSRKATSGEQVKYLILVATSGDTGSAVLEGFKGSSNIKVLVLYPQKGISTVQKSQMTAADGRNTCVIGVESDFDFCQSSIKTIFNDLPFSKKLMDSHNVKLSAANSLNWGRLLPQVVYHASAYLDLVKSGVISMGEAADLCVPTGNFGNILGAYYAKAMGIPLNNLICASNENNILTEFFRAGSYNMASRRLKQTISPSIDILKSSNLERLLYHATENNGAAVAHWMASLEEDKYFKVSDDIRKELSTIFKADCTTDDKYLKTLKSTHEQTGYILDTHTAVAMDIASRFAHASMPMIVSATAHYSKFAYDVLRGLGEFPSCHEPRSLFFSLKKLDARPAMHANLEAVVSRPQIHKGQCEANVNAVMNQVESFVEK